MSTDNALSAQVLQITPAEAVTLAEQSGNQEAAIMAALYQSALSTIREILIECDHNQAVVEIADFLDFMLSEDDTPTLN